MRVVSEIPGDLFNTTIYSWNNKFLLKFEQGFYEQTYKINELDLMPGTDLTEVLKNQEFLDKVMKRFDEMAGDFHHLIGDYV